MKLTVESGKSWERPYMPREAVLELVCQQLIDACHHVLTDDRYGLDILQDAIDEAAELGITPTDNGS